MDTFEFISVALSFVLGLGVTHQLSALVRVFLARKRMRADWIPILWAISVFVMMIQYWWAIFELSDVDVWPVHHFMFFMALALLLFLAGALVLPTPLFDEADDLGQLFEEHGRWGLAVLVVYGVTVLFGNAVFWEASPFSAVGVSLMVLIVLPPAALVTRRRSTRGLMTLAYFVGTLISAWLASPAAY